GLTDCADSECCVKDECKDNIMCVTAPDPLDILLRKQPPAVTATFYQKMKFLIEEDSVQSYAHRDEYSESQFWTAFAKSRVSVIRGRVVNKERTGLIAVRVSVATDPQFGFTLTRLDG
ncbi:teneurin-a-like, partial [Stegodyphus dumicola]|uniref:teneurin-a-like n=1 Tax=Stegodyphus dumicola TaxID=202533 RepID=UPI0015AFCF3C